MEWTDIKQQAKERLQGICRLCRICNGLNCAGEIPGIGGVGSGSSFINNYQALLKVRLNLRTLHNVSNPTTEVEILGHKLALPVLGAAVAGCRINFQGRMSEEEFCWSQVQGALAAGTVALTGDGGHTEIFAAGIKAVQTAKGAAIPIIKPRPLPDLISRLRQAEEAGAMAVGIDVDAAGLINMRLLGQPVGPLDSGDLEIICQSTKLPVIVKGIMTPDEAVVACEAGAQAIVVSNHGGRALDHTPGTAEVLPQIAQAVRGRITILADGGVRTGTDVLKFLALGADAVLVGRPVVWAAFGGGAEGVQLLYQKLATELKVAMILTGCAAPQDAGEHLLAVPSLNQSPLIDTQNNN